MTWRLFAWMAASPSASAICEPSGSMRTASCMHKPVWAAWNRPWRHSSTRRPATWLVFLVVPRLGWTGPALRWKRQPTLEKSCAGAPSTGSLAGGWPPAAAGPAGAGLVRRMNPSKAPDVLPPEEAADGPALAGCCCAAARQADAATGPRFSLRAPRSAGVHEETPGHSQVSSSPSGGLTQGGRSGGALRAAPSRVPGPGGRSRRRPSAAHGCARCSRSRCSSSGASRRQR